MMKLPATALGLLAIAFATPACYRASDEYLADKEAKMMAQKKAKEDAAQGQADDPVADVPAGSAPGDDPQSGGGPDEIRDLFGKMELSQALPLLEAEMKAYPDEIGPLLQGAFAGVGNETEACEEILLYMAIRHPEMAEQLASVAAQVNPEIQSWRQ